MHDIKVDHLGCTCFWTIPEKKLPHEDVVAAWVDAGLPDEVLPSPPRPSKALRRAVSELRDRRRLARRLERGGSWAIVREDAVGEDLHHEVETKAVLERSSGDNGQPSVQLRAEGVGAERIRELYGEEQGLCHRGELARMLIDSVHHLRGVALRREGGFYFVPAEGVELFARAAAVVEALVPGARVYRLQAQVDEAGVRAVLDALLAETEQEVAHLENDLMRTGDAALGARALRTRADRMAELKEKVKRYEALLATALPEVQDKLEQCRALAYEAAIAAEAEAEMNAAMGV